MINTTSDIEKCAKIARAAEASAIWHIFQISPVVLIINCTTYPCDYLFIICMTKSLSLYFNCILSRVFNSFVSNLV